MEKITHKKADTLQENIVNLQDKIYKLKTSEMDLSKDGFNHFNFGIKINNYSEKSINYHDKKLAKLIYTIVKSQIQSDLNELQIEYDKL